MRRDSRSGPPAIAASAQRPFTVLNADTPLVVLPPPSLRDVAAARGVRYGVPFLQLPFAFAPDLDRLVVP